MNRILNLAHLDTTIDASDALGNSSQSTNCGNSSYSTGCGSGN